MSGKTALENMELIDFRTKIVHNKFITPSAKGFIGIILFKLENKIPLEENEDKFFNEIKLFIS